MPEITPSEAPTPTPADPRRSTSGRASRRWWIAGLAIAALVVVILAPLASPDPDGLERVAGDQGFLDRAQDAVYSILPDYSIPGLDNPALSTILSGLIGIALVFGAMWLLGRVLARRRNREAPR